MLGDQGSPYVGRFARGWRRLPGVIPGQPQTRTRARSSIGSTARPRERPRGRQQVDRAGAGTPQCLGRGGSGGAGGEDVIDQQDVRRHGDPIAHRECPTHRRPTLCGVALSLRPGRDRAPKQPPDRKVELPAHAGGEGPGLIEPSLGQAAARQRNPRDQVGTRGQVLHGGDRRGQRGADPPPAGELQPMHRPASRPLEAERRSGAVEDRRRTVVAGPHRPGPRPAAPLAPRRRQRHQLITTIRAEGPWTRGAAGASLREDDIQRAGQHRRNLSRATDTAR